MLVLNRGIGESLMIGEDVEVKVLDANVVLGPDNTVVAVKVSIGVSAPQSVPVHRLEVYRRIKEGKPRPVPRVIRTVSEAPTSEKKAAVGS